MKVAFLHYHLRPGGVTTVIKRQVAAVKPDCETLVLCSHPSGELDGLDAPVSHVPLVAYGHKVKETFTPRDLAGSILEAIHRRWPDGCDVLHVHNPLLAKNRELLKALEILRDQGMSLFLQVHDFAEDGRPDVYYDREYVADVHYGVINSRDYDILRKAGLKEEGLHLVANNIKPFPADNDVSPDSDTPGSGMVLYPVRAIRRKNIGEVLLFSLFLGKNQAVGITLPPGSHGDRTSYLQWKSFIRDHHFDVHLDVGETGDYRQLVKRAPFILTTSVNEGFGFSFLEPWTAGKMVFGRYLPHVCEDFQRRGVELRHLYSDFRIPLETIASGNGKEPFYERWRHSLFHSARAFGYSLDPATVGNAFRQLTPNRSIDFGVLDEAAQMNALLQIKNHTSMTRRVRELNPWLREQPGTGTNTDTIAHNDRIVRQCYGNENYRKTLLDIYQKVAHRSVVHCIHRETLLDEFLDPFQYKMLQWSAVESNE
ncbi:MAG: glycosyltransferase family 4 protein [bacterium]|nr:glycosyltransferase family 4 protein [bacterium]